MRVVQLVQQPLRRGGEVFALQLGEELERRGHECRWVYLYDTPAGPDRLTVRGSDLVLRGDITSRLETTLGVHPRLAARLRGALARLQPDIVQLNGARSVKYGAVLRRSGGRFATVYRNIGDPDEWIRGTLRNAYYKHVVFPGIDAIAAVGASTARSLRRRFAAEVPIEVIPTGVSEQHLTPRTPRNELRRMWDTPDDAVVLLFVGRLSPEKRLDRLVDAVARVETPVVLWVVGSGPERERAEALATELGIDARFCGVQTEVGSYYAAANVGVLSSDTEGVPAVLLEAGWAGLPVVSTDVGAASECVRDGTDGWLVPTDVATFANAIDRLASDADERRQFGHAFRERVRAEFTMSRIAERYEALYLRAQR